MEAHGSAWVLISTSLLCMQVPLKFDLPDSVIQEWFGQGDQSGVQQAWPQQGHSTAQAAGRQQGGRHPIRPRFVYVYDFKLIGMLSMI